MAAISHKQRDSFPSLNLNNIQQQAQLPSTHSSPCYIPWQFASAKVKTQVFYHQDDYNVQVSPPVTTEPLLKRLFA